jgi:pimeloyl-ACP methyl ester carboxylesterase
MNCSLEGGIHMLHFQKMRQLIKSDAKESLESTCNEHQGTGESYREYTEFSDYNVTHTVVDGIERIHYQPKTQQQKSVLIFQHGMWHGAWCWKYWQVWFAEQGWESIAFSLPGHGKSLEQKKVEECTLAYYLYFLEQEIKSIEAPVVLCAHSMGGALAQWYLKFFGNLPAIVSIAGWTSHDILKDCLFNAMKIDPWGSFLASFLGAKAQFRNEQVVKKWFLSDHSIMSPKELKGMLGRESEVVLMQHRPATWTPISNNTTPMLWLAAEDDAIISIKNAKKSADFYNADFRPIPDCNHDIMLEHNWQASAEIVKQWLESKLV